MMMRKNKKGDIWVSVVLYVLIIVAVTVLILNAGIPLLNKLKDKSLFAKTEDTMLGLNQNIRDVANEGQGSQRVVSINVKTGTFNVGSDKLSWTIDSDSKIVEPRTTIDRGDLKIKANSDVSAVSYDHSFTLENSRILANFTRYGNSTNWVSYNTSSLINSILFVATNETTPGNFNFLLNGAASTGIGNGYTSLQNEGTGLGSSVLVAHMNSSTYEYDLKFTLESEADFLKIEVDKLAVK